MWKYSYYPTSNELYHHGILGQKWGKRNGPPYPLGASDHSASEKKAGWRASIARHDKDKYNSYRLSDVQKKALKIGAAAIGVSLLTIGAHELGYDKRLIEYGRNAFKKYCTNSIDTTLRTSKNFVGQSVFDTAHVGRSFESIKRDMPMILSINSDNRNVYGGNTNCLHCATAYILNTGFGQKTKAKALPYVDELSGLVHKGEHAGRDPKLIRAIFNNIREIDCIEDNPFSKEIRKIPRGSSGMLFVHRNDYYHVMNYEKNILGITTIIDSQEGFIKNGFNGFSHMNDKYSLVGIMDFSKATLSDSAKDILEHIVI